MKWLIAVLIVVVILATGSCAPKLEMEIVLQAELAQKDSSVSEDALMIEVVKVIERRVTEYGIPTMNIQRQSGGRIVIQVPKVRDTYELTRLIS